MGQGTGYPPSITINNDTLEAINTFTYLGSTITDNLSLDAELSRCIGKAALEHPQLRYKDVCKHDLKTPTIITFHEVKEI